MTASALVDGGPAARVERAYPTLDGLRLLAATAVVITHTGFATGHYTSDAFGGLLARLEIGVPVFFVLSGFLLTRPYVLAGVHGIAGPRTRAYLWRRTLRILPARRHVVCGCRGRAACPRGRARRGTPPAGRCPALAAGGGAGAVAGPVG